MPILAQWFFLFPYSWWFSLTSHNLIQQLQNPAIQRNCDSRKSSLIRNSHEKESQLRSDETFVTRVLPFHPHLARKQVHRAASLKHQIQIIQPKKYIMQYDNKYLEKYKRQGRNKDVRSHLSSVMKSDNDFSSEFPPLHCKNTQDYNRKMENMSSSWKAEKNIQRIWVHFLIHKNSTSLSKTWSLQLTRTWSKSVLPQHQAINPKEEID